MDVQFFIFYFSCLRAIGFLFFECVKKIFLEKNLSIIFLFSWSFRENSTYLVFVYSLIFFLFFLSRFYPCLSSCISCRLFLIGHVYLVYISVLLYLCLLATVCLLLLPCLPKKMYLIYVSSPALYLITRKCLFYVLAAWVLC